MQKAIIAVSCFLTSLTNFLPAGEVDALVEMNRLLKKKPNVMYRPGTLPGSPPIPIGIILVGPAAASSAVVRESYVTEVSTVTFDQAKIASLPEVVLYTKKQLLNCADANVNSTVSITIAGNHSWSTAKTDGISTTKSKSLAGQIQFKEIGSLSATINWSQTISCSTTITEGFQESISRSMSDTVSIGPRKAVQVSLIAYQNTIEIPFHATVTVDGELFQNLGGLRKASALLSKEERTFPINGILSVSDVSEATIRTDDLQGTIGCDGEGRKLTNNEFAQLTFPKHSMSPRLNSAFASKADAPRIGKALKPMSRSFGPLAAITSSDDPILKPPDGTHYEILYTTEIAKPTISCGFNDNGIPNPGLFTLEAREYRTYLNGQLTAQWQEQSETFKACYPP